MFIYGKLKDDTEASSFKLNGYGGVPNPHFF